MQRQTMRTSRHSFRNQPPAAAPEQPIADLNITPLIDVLLVLLVMLMLSIPLATHKVDIDLPVGGTDIAPVLTNNLQLNAAGMAIWNGAVISDKQLSENLIAMSRDPAEPQLFFETNGQTRYERFDQIVALIKRSEVNEIGFSGNEQFASWDKAI